MALVALRALQRLTERIGEEFVAASYDLEELEGSYQRAASRGALSLRVFLLNQWLRMTRWTITRWLQGKAGELTRSWNNMRRST